MDTELGLEFSLVYNRSALNQIITGLTRHAEHLRQEASRLRRSDAQQHKIDGTLSDAVKFEAAAKHLSPILFG